MHGDDLGKPPRVRRSESAASALKGAATIASSIALVLALSLAIVWPLWSLATKAPSAYTIAFGAAFVLVAVVAIAGARRRRPHRRRRPRA